MSAGEFPAPKLSQQDQDALRRASNWVHRMSEIASTLIQGDGTADMDQLAGQLEWLARGGDKITRDLLASLPAYVSAAACAEQYRAKLQQAQAELRQFYLNRPAQIRAWRQAQIAAGHLRAVD